MEEKIRIKTSDKKHWIYGALTYRRKPIKKVLILVHGNTDWMNSGMNRECAKYFAARGWATLRFNLYGNESDARKLYQSGMSDHAADIKRVISYCRRRHFEHICLAGHSLGWPCILLAQPKKVDALISWDGTVPEVARDLSDWSSYRKAVKGYVVDWRVRLIFGSKVKRDREQCPDADELMEGLDAPVLFLMADKCMNKEGAWDYYHAAIGPRKYVLMKGASHNFEEEGKQERLIAETFSWCEVHSR